MKEYKIVEELEKKVHSLPPYKQRELLDYVDFLLSRYKVADNKKTPEFGCMKGTFEMKEGFDDPISSFEDYMP